MADGWITIETKLATDKFDKQIANLEKKIEKTEKRKELKYEAKIEAETNLEKKINEIQELKKQYGELQEKQNKFDTIRRTLYSGEGTPKLLREYQALNEELKSMNLEKLKSSIQKAEIQQKSLEKKVKQTSLSYGEIKAQVQDYKSKVESIKINKQQAQVEQLRKGFSKIGNSVDTAVKKIGRMAMGIFSVASAYRLMSSASSTLGQYDEQYATNLEYIRYLIAQAIAPALKYVVNLASTLLSYLNYIAKAWFNVTLFSKNSAKNFAKAQGSTSKIKKDLQTTPFDEMNVLSDTSTSGGGVTAPSIDPSVIAGEVPEWIKWIAENKDLVIGALTGIAIAIGLIKLSDLIGGLSTLGKLFEPVKTFLTTYGKQFAGILSIIGGIFLIIEGIKKYLEDPTWENFIIILGGIALVVGGVMLLFGGIPALITAIILIVGALGLAIYKHWDEIKEVLGKVGQWVYDHIIQPIVNFFKGLWETIVNVTKAKISIMKGFFTTLVEILKNPFVILWETVKGLFESIKTIFTGIFNIIKGIFTGDIKKVLEGAKQIFKGFADAIWTILKAPINFLIGGINALIKGINKISFDVPDWVPGIGGKKLGFNIQTIPKLKKGTILNNPGRGVPVAGGRAIAGESGREAFLPLSDTQLLQELGSTIGRYITINANIVNNMNGRTISRQLQKIQNDNDFAYNT